MKRATVIKKCSYRIRRNFNPRPHEEGDLNNLNRTAYSTTISIHALMKRATARSGSISFTISDFNPRPHEEGDRTENLAVRQAFISIHALMKRATKVIEHSVVLLCISIHALMKRATGRFLRFLRAA